MPKTDIEKLAVSMEFLYIVYILRTETSPDKPETYMQASEVTTAFKSASVDILEGEDLKRSIRPKLDILANAQGVKEPADDQEFEALNEDEKFLVTLYYKVIPKVFGGCVRRCHSGLKNNMYLYYFEPFLKDEHAALMAGALTASQFLSSEEKDYMVTAIQHLSSLGHKRHKYKLKETHKRDDAYKKDPTQPEVQNEVDYGEEFSYAKLPVLPMPQKLKPSSLPGGQSRYLNIVSCLDYAIKNHCVIFMQYGRYSTRRGNTALTFETRTNPYTQEQPYPMNMVNPYALFWSNGHHYLICSGYQKDEEKKENRESDQPLVYRVDKIIRVQLALRPWKRSGIQVANKGESVPEDSAVSSKLDPSRYLQWTGYPEVIKGYFDKKGHFDEERYTIEHPLQAYMYQYADQFVDDCTLEIKMGALSVLVDYFGTDPERIRVKEIDTPEKFSIENPQEQKFEVTLKHIQYHCLRLFCKQFSHLVVVKSPERLRKSVQYNLMETQSLWGPIL